MTCKDFGNMQTDNKDCSTCPKANECALETLDRSEHIKEMYNRAIAPKPKASQDLKCSMNILGNDVLLKIPLEGLVEIWLKKHMADGSNDCAQT